MATAKAKSKKAANEIVLEVVGLGHRMSPAARRQLASRIPLPAQIEREPDNFHDPNAIRVVVAKEAAGQFHGQIGYLRRQVSQEWAEPLDDGRLVIEYAEILSVLPDEAIAKVKIGFNKPKITP